MLADTLARFPDRFRGIALMPEDTGASEFARLTRLGVRGLRMMSAKRGPHVPRLFTRHRRARGRDTAGTSSSIRMTPTSWITPTSSWRLPNTIVLDHFASVPAAGGVDQAAFTTVLRMLDTGRVWVKLSGPMRCTKQNYPYPEVTPLAHALVRHAPERLVWGTDWPHVNLDGREMPNDGDLLDLLAEWVPDGATRDRDPRRQCARALRISTGKSSVRTCCRCDNKWTRKALVQSVYLSLRFEILTACASIVSLKRDRKLIPSNPSTPSPKVPWPSGWTTTATSLA